METLDEIRKRKLKEMLEQHGIYSQQNEMENKERQIDEQLEILTNKILSPEANDRMNNLRIAMPDFARQVGILLVQLYQSGKITSVITDEQFKQILMQLKNKKEASIKRISK